MDLSQSTAVCEVLPPGDFGVNKSTEKFDMENQNLFMTLKSHIDSQCKLNQVYRCRIRSFERFRKYCQRVARFGDGAPADKFDLGQFLDEYNRFDQNYRYFRKRIRKIRKQTIKSSNPYDSLYELFAQIESLDGDKDNNNLDSKKNDYQDHLDHPLSSPSSVNIIEPAESASDSFEHVNFDSTATQENIECEVSILNQSITKDNLNDSKKEEETIVTVPSKPPETTENETGTTQDKLKCFVAGCGQMFNDKNSYLEHLFAHSNDVGRPKPAKRIQTKRSKTIVTRQTRTRQTTTKKTTKHQKAAKKRSYNRVQEKSAKDSLKEKNEVPIVFKCDFEGCQYTGDKLWRLNSHKKIHSDIKPYKCSVEGCKYSTNKQWRLNTHQKTHSDIRPFKCDLCTMAFKFKGQVKVHKTTVHEGKRYPCTEEGCSASLWSADSLRRHIKIVHTDNPEVYQCKAEGCNYTSLKIEAFRRHSVIHSDERPFKCMWPGCGKAFKLYITRKDHILMHKNERQYKCKYPDCSYACNTTNNLRKHHVVHEKKEARQNAQNSNPLNLNSMIGQNNANNNNLFC